MKGPNHMDGVQFYLICTCLHVMLSSDAHGTALPLSKVLKASILVTPGPPVR